MNEISYAQCELVGGGTVLALLAFGLAVLSQAEAINDFCAGFLDGAGGIR